MGGVVNSAGGFLGTSQGPQAPQGQFGNAGLTAMNDQNSIFGQGEFANLAQGDLNAYSNGNMTSQQAQQAAQASGANGGQMQGFNNALATGATTGSKYAAEQLGNNATQAGLYGVNGQGGQLGNAETQLNNLQNQGYELKPEDQTLYGQASGQIARNYGQQGNDLANSLASRGLSSSGAAGAQFSGLAGNQNEQLANAQQGIMQQRFQNTMNQIGQQQNYISQLGGQYNSALQQQYGRQLSGAQNQTQGLMGQSNAQQNANNSENSYGMQAANFNAQNKPANFMDYYDAGLGSSAQAIGGGSGKIASSGAGAGGSLFGG